MRACTCSDFREWLVAAGGHRDRRRERKARQKEEEREEERENEREERQKVGRVG